MHDYQGYFVILQVFPGGVGTLCRSPRC